MVVEKLYELPICYEKWKEIFDIEETELYRIWTIVNHLFFLQYYISFQQLLCLVKNLS
jgi:hypothetical protein